MQKTNKAVRKRFKVTARGKVLVRGAGKRHLLAHKTSKAKRRIGRARVISETDAYRVKGSLPYHRRRYRNRRGNPAPAAEPVAS